MIELTESFLFNILGGVLFIILLFQLFISSKSGTKFDNVSCFSLIFTVVVFFGFRSVSSGVDTLAYHRYFEHVSLFQINNLGFEPGFYLFTRVFSYFNAWNAYLIAIVLIQLFFVFVSAKLLRIKSVFLVLLLYVALLPGFDLLTNGLRQGVALCFGGTMLVLAHNNTKYKLLSVIPFLFHKSLLLNSLLVFIPRFFAKLSIIRLLVILGAVVAGVGFLGSQFGGGVQFSSLLPIPLPGSGHTLGAKMDMYLYIEKQLLSNTMKMYFLILSYSLFLPYLYYLFTRPEVVVRLNFIALVTVVMHNIYLLIWWTNFSYRFMYISYVPIILLSIASIEGSKGKYFMVYLYLIALLGVFTTYSSKNYSSFSFGNLLG